MPEASPLDPTLIGRRQTGNQEAIAELLERYKNPVYRTAVLTLGDAGEADDVMQEVFV
jgi:RNA polymerase sigma-70 factor (ECF subfamily)